MHDPSDAIHRIGGGGLESLRLKQRERSLVPPGISVLRGGTPQEAARQVRDAFPNATRLHRAAETIGTTAIDEIRAAGFDIIPDPSRKLPNHHRIVHPDGAAGFDDEENLKKLSQVFQDTTGN